MPSYGVSPSTLARVSLAPFWMRNSPSVPSVSYAMTKWSALLPCAFWWLMLDPLASTSSISFRLQFWAPMSSSVLPLSSWESTGKSALSESSSRRRRELRACEKTVSRSGTPVPARSFCASSSRTTATFIIFSCSESGRSLSRAKMTFRTCSLCSIPSTWARSSSRSSSKNSPSTLASLKALVYCWSESVSSQRQTSVTDQRRTSLGKGSALDCLACSSAFRAASSSSCCFLSAASITSSAPSFKCLIAGMFAAAAAAAAAEAASALEAMAAEVVSELISRICLSMLRDEKYESDMDMN
mmetsp:Transcript_20688/g.43472  ORF Transcript_20688/g.43472 Transcript_20688/m.43472 type:complete len:299 (-) Transcript_20688:155-1051(-)